MKTSSSESLITGILFRLSILAVGIGGVTAALFAAADALEHRAPSPAADAAKVGPTFAARDTAPPAPRARPVEATASAAAPAPARPAAVLPADRPAALAPAASRPEPQRQDVQRQDLAGLPPPADVGAARALAPAEAPRATAPDAAARPETSRTRPAAASPSTASVESAARPAVGLDEARPAAGATSTPVGSGSATPAARPQRGQAGCTQYRSYDPKTGTYRGFDGKVRECNAVASN